MSAELFLIQLSHISFSYRLFFFLIENYSLLVIAILIGKMIEPGNTILDKKDRKWVISTLICNTLITALGFELYQLGVIRIDFSHNLFSIIIDAILLILIMDFCMFCFHYLAHSLKTLHRIHNLHHTHVSTNIYSLFVLHPIETLGFGIIWLCLISLFEFNYIGLIVYLFLNLMYGILGHLKKNIFPESWSENVVTKWISDTKFHNDHHQNETHNFGFYFTYWDKIFKTII